jgi:hypothetical protein
MTSEKWHAESLALQRELLTGKISRTDLKSVVRRSTTLLGDEVSLQGLQEWPCLHFSRLTAWLPYCRHVRKAVREKLYLRMIIPAACDGGPGNGKMERRVGHKSSCESRARKAKNFFDAQNLSAKSAT